jgi:hypothetical protein
VAGQGPELLFGIVSNKTPRQMRLMSATVYIHVWNIAFGVSAEGVIELGIGRQSSWGVFIASTHTRCG